MAREPSRRLCAQAPLARIHDAHVRRAPRDGVRGSGRPVDLAQRIGQLPRVAAVYCSPITRARETAQPIARAVKRALRIERDLADLDIGEWTGFTLKQAARRPEWETVQRNPSSFRFPGVFTT